METTPTACATCSASGVLLRCGKCLQTAYCNRECQRRHWPVHKTSCGVSSSSSTYHRRRRHHEAVLTTADGRHVPLPRLANSEAVPSCLHAAPRSTSTIARTIATLATKHRGDVFRAAHDLSSLSASEIEHLIEAMRSMAVDAALDRNWTAMLHFYRTSRYLHLFSESGMDLVEKLSDDEEIRGRVLLIEQTCSSFGSVLESLRAITSCSCLQEEP